MCNIRGYIVRSMLLSMVLLVFILGILFRNVHDSCNAPFWCWGRGIAKGEGVDVVCTVGYYGILFTSLLLVRKFLINVYIHAFFVTNFEIDLY